MKEVVIMSYSHRTFTVLLLGLASCWLFALVEAQKSPPQCNMVGQIRVGNPLYNNESCIVNLTNIEVCESDGWRVLCDTDLSERDAQVICRELGYSDIGAAAGKFRQLVGGFLTTKFPVCNGNEQRLSECEQLDRSGAVCVEKLFVTCFLSGTDATMCGISTELPSTTSDKSTMRQAPSTSSAPLHPTTQVVDLPKATSASFKTDSTATTATHSLENESTNGIIMVIGASMGGIFGVTLFALIVFCMILHCKSVTFKAYVQRNKITNPHITEMIDKPTEGHQKEYSVIYDSVTDSIAKFPKMTRLYTFKYREEDTTDPSVVALKENIAYITHLSETRRNPSLCSEVTDSDSATKDHQEMPIYEVIAENTSNSQDTSEVSAHWSHGKTDSVTLKTKMA